MNSIPSVIKTVKYTDGTYHSIVEYNPSDIDNLFNNLSETSTQVNQDILEDSLPTESIELSSSEDTVTKGNQNHSRYINILNNL